LCDTGRIGKESGAALLAFGCGGEEIVTEIEAAGWAFGHEMNAVLCRDVGEAVGDIVAAGEDHALAPRAHRGKRGTGLIAAIEQRHKTRVANRLLRRRDQRSEPARTGINSGIGRAGKDQRPTGARRGSERADRLRQRVDNNYGLAAADILPGGPLVAGYRGCSSDPLTRSSTARSRSTIRRL
jgi:hypothetical protein